MIRLNIATPVIWPWYLQESAISNIDLKIIDEIYRTGYFVQLKIIN